MEKYSVEDIKSTDELEKKVDSISKTDLENITKETIEGDEYSHYISREYEIMCPKGLHARPASIVVQAMNKYEGHVVIRYNKKTFNAKSIMQIMMNAIEGGEKIEILYEPLKSNSQSVYDIIEKPLKEILKPL